MTGHVFTCDHCGLTVGPLGPPTPWAPDGWVTLEIFEGGHQTLGLRLCSWACVGATALAAERVREQS